MILPALNLTRLLDQGFDYGEAMERFDPFCADTKKDCNI